MQASLDHKQAVGVDNKNIITGGHEKQLSVDS